MWKKNRELQRGHEFENADSGGRDVDVIDGCLEAVHEGRQLYTYTRLVLEVHAFHKTNHAGETYGSLLFLWNHNGSVVLSGK